MDGWFESDLDGGLRPVAMVVVAAAVAVAVAV